MYVYMCAYIYTRAYLSLSLSLYICIYIYMYIYIYTCVVCFLLFRIVMCKCLRVTSNTAHAERWHTGHRRLLSIQSLYSVQRAKEEQKGAGLTVCRTSVDLRACCSSKHLAAPKVVDIETDRKVVVPPNGGPGIKWTEPPVSPGMNRS